MSGTRLVVLVVTAVCLSLSAGDAAIVPTEPLLVKQSDDKRKAGNCSPDRFPSAVGNPISCCQEGNRTYHTNDGKTLALRVFAKPCTEADGESTNCEGTGCVYGPCGARIEWAVTAEAVRVFKPVSKPEKCGWDVQKVINCRVGCDWPPGSNREYPEPFTNQVQYPGLTSTCPFTGCARGGIPTR
jgi:hypothetical protein